MLSNFDISLITNLFFTKKTSKRYWKAKGFIETAEILLFSSSVNNATVPLHFGPNHKDKYVDTLTSVYYLLSLSMLIQFKAASKQIELQNRA